MQYVRNKIIVVALSLLLCAIPAIGQESFAAGDKEKEYKVKAAFVYNFMKFIDWEGMAISGFKDKPDIGLGIVGDDPFDGGLEALKSKTIGDKKITVYYFSFDSLADEAGSKQLSSCNVVFISKSEQKHYAEITGKIADSNVLTIGDEDSFANSCGVISFDIEKGKVCFDINLNNAKKSGIKIDVKLLKLARKVYKD
ncbi:MAG: YfiR family protein [Sedimentisphaerales bacterium]|nr:YfiR family protein [Sedimentisphaerales bacterium]MBN2842070.1 YfiR family protein [Sedimentisphaerales bacterium]